jgi:hypothetical protein
VEQHAYAEDGVGMAPGALMEIKNQMAKSKTTKENAKRERVDMRCWPGA